MPGPVSNEMQFKKCLDAFALARSEGDQIVAGGGSFDGDGFYVKPTIIVPNTLESSSYRKEIFGPVGTFVAYDNEEEMIRMMNNTP